MASDHRIGTRIGRYHIQSLIGRGGMGVVYLAEHERLRRKVALKVLAPTLAEDQAFRDRFIRESQLAASLEHPSIVSIYEADEADGVLYIAMRFVLGSDLKRIVTREGPLELDRTVAVLEQVASALDAAHAHGLVHRDVKPSNILVSPGDPDTGERAYLADFGLTKVMDQSTTASGFTGTPDYMAPEQIRGEHVDARTDVYALGCVLYECLTGQVPFKGKGDSEGIYTVFAHLEEPPPTIGERRPDLPPHIDQVIASAMAKEPGSRYEDCASLVRAAGGVVTARPSTATLRSSAAGERRDPAVTSELTVGPGEERKVVTVLFSELVGSSARSDEADPEDLRAIIRPYHTTLRREVERFGGSVEKVVGESALAVFGAPLAHEDDPERAVRAGLRIVEAVAEMQESNPTLDLQVRIGIDTGTALVSLGARAELGESAVEGGVVNSASRLQAAAPVNGVIVGTRTHQATSAQFDYEEIEPVVLRGTTEPVPVFHAKAARARFGTDVSRALTPLVGRELDSSILTGVFERSVRDQSVHLVTIVGEAGVGKSRLVAELFTFVDSLPDLVRWRQGRCLPYGDAVTFWALGEIVKAEAGILETDSPDVAVSKIDAAVPDTHPDAAWLRQRLRPLAGMEAPQASREENFAAWRAFLESLADDSPSVVVFEDLHWADEAFLAFLEHLADYAEGVPLLVVSTARPELFDRSPGFAQHARNSHRVNLSPLSGSEMALLISNLLEQAVLPADVQQAILARAGGNPLYAEEFVRLLRDQGILAKRGYSWTIDPHAEIPIPSGVQSLVAARLDTLPADRKRLLQDAAVVGKVFWSEAVAAMGRQDPATVRLALHQLARNELIRPARTTSMEGQAEYAFSHTLVQDVCYAQIPRAQRAERHRRAAAWIEEIASDRVEDHAEILAAHYSTALELVAASTGPHAEDLEAKAVRYLVLAGDRAMGIDVEAAERHYARSLDLMAGEDSERPAALARHGEALLQRGRYAEASPAFEAAIAGFEATGDVEAVAAAKRGLGKVVVHTNPPRARELSAESLAMLEPLGPSRALVRALADEAHGTYVVGDNVRAVALADRALQLAADLDLPGPPTALQARGGAQAILGDPAGVQDLRRGLEAAQRAGLGREVAVGYLGLAYVLGPIEGPRAGLEILREGLAFAERRGIEELVSVLQTSINDCLIDLGSYDEVMTLCERIAPRLEAAEDLWSLTWVRGAQALILARRGRPSEAVAAADWAAGRARVAAESQFVDAFSVQAGIRLALGDPVGALAVLSEVEQIPQIREEPEYVKILPQLVATALGAGDLHLATRLGEGVASVWPLHEHSLITVRAMLTEHRGEHGGAGSLFADAAQRWEHFEMPWERARALLGRGRCLLALGRPAEATPAIREARRLFATLDARPGLKESDTLLEQAIAASS